ncbi:MAG: 4-hydroxy-3-methylbut-2-enyl diphosphate reductase [Clostridia bacterium]
MITVAKNAGFCFGVKRAVDIIENKLNAKQNIFCIGEIIHNKIFMDSLKKRGVVVIEPENFEQIPINSDAVIRTHGVSKQVYGNLDKNKIAYIDATCPFVEKIHKIAAEQSSDGSICIILGDKNHPEVRGIMSFAKFGGEVFDNANDALKYIKNITLTGKSFFVVSQTTFDTREWKFFDNNLRNLYTNAKIFDTICSVTENRQNEALSLAKSADLTVVVGGKTSSNTAKLFSIATDNCKNAIWVENGDSIYEYRDIIKKAKNMVIIAGASTPSVIIQEVNNIMAEILNEELSFAEMLDQSFKTLNTGERVVGVVSAVSSAEIKVDLGTKHTGILPYDEIVNEGSIDLEKEFHIGDSIEVMCLKFSDVEGTVLLSKKRLDENKNLTAISNAAESGEILHGTVKEIVKGGVVVYINGIRVFVPASQCGPEGLDLETLKNAKVPVKIFEYNAQRKRAVGSIRFAKRSERKEKLDELYASLTIGQKITGTIHSIMNYGIFVTEWFIFPNFFGEEQKILLIILKSATKSTYM